MKGCRAALVSLLLLVGAVGSVAADDSGSGRMKLGEFIPTPTPRPAPAVSFVDAAGKTFPLSQFKGKPVLVNLWATWCRPCVEEMPSLNGLQQRLGDRLTVLAISEDRGGNKVVQRFVDRLGLTNLKIFLDPEGAFGRAFAVHGLPTTILIDVTGKVRGRILGQADWSAPKMLDAIKPFLSPKEPSATAKRSATVKSSSR
jgi:thiol-disulfide isomerase/thioredoxin